MMRAFEQLSELAMSAAIAAADNLTGMFGPGSRFFLPYIATAVVIAILANRLNRNPESKNQNVLAALFGRNVIFHPSSAVDFKLVIANRLFTPILSLAGRASIVVSAHFVAVTLTGGADTTSASLRGPALLALTLCVVVANDFTTYWVHRLHHESAVLWPFHKVHHSAEVMTPLTFARKHPIYDLVRGLSNFAILGPVQGVVLALFGVTDVVTILGVNAVYALFHWTGSNLRHSHVWLSYGPVLNRIFISPAQHQIHHSCAVRHHDKNYGEVFALWDWMFGTLYAPETYEAIEFGVADRAGVKIPQPHRNLKEAWIGPLRESAQAFREKGAEPQSEVNAL
jgi:sterol desaturase/sphingolipid hydroxylase (fatty acid hydroxylase superfamily)